MKKFYSRIDDAITAWRDGNDRARSGNVFADGDNLYSYGYHFVLATRVNDSKGGVAYLINGDKYSVSTARHTNDCIHLLDNNFQIPFSALAGAGISTRPYKLTLIKHYQDQYSTEHYKDKEGKDQTRQVHHLGECVIKYNKRYFLSGFDRNENWGNGYFLTELDKKYYKPGDDPIESLMPPDVKTYLDRGHEVKRQGEWFFVKTNMLTRELKPFTKYPASKTETTWINGGWDTGEYVAPKRNDRFINLGYSWVYKREPVTHCATELRTNGKYFYARGTIKHNPEQGRRKTHKRLSLGKAWYLVVKNTAIGSWESTGSVD